MLHELVSLYVLNQCTHYCSALCVVQALLETFDPAVVEVLEHPGEAWAAAVVGVCWKDGTSLSAPVQRYLMLSNHQTQYMMVG